MFKNKLLFNKGSILLNPVKTKRSYLTGFTTIELIIGLFILSVIGLGITLLFLDISKYGTLITQNLSAQQEIDQTFQFLVSELRSINPSNTGSYPLVQVSTSSLSFYADYDDDGLFEQIRYFLSGTTLKKGIIKPAGNPLVYNPATEEVSDMVHHIVSSSIFTYYGQDYSGLEAKLNYPINISDVRIIKIEISTKDPNHDIPTTQTLFLTPRNLRTNI